MMTGKPILSAIFMFSCSSVPTGPSEPGTVGTPECFMALMAETLSPISLMLCEVGPTKMKPERSTCSAKSAFSERKP